MKASAEYIKLLDAELVSRLYLIRKLGNRELMRETVMRIRQLRGILELRGMA